MQCVYQQTQVSDINKSHKKLITLEKRICHDLLSLRFLIFHESKSFLIRNLSPVNRGIQTNKNHPYLYELKEKYYGIIILKGFIFKVLQQ